MSNRILIVEDSPTQAEQLRLVLEENGYQVMLAADGEQGLVAAHAHKPALIISDLVMPVMDGYEMCRVLKQDEALTDVPIIMLTALTDLEDVIRGLKAGADYYLTKPCAEDIILRRVKTALATPPLKRSEEPVEELVVTYAGERYVITSDRQQIMKLLFSTYESAIRQNQELVQVHLELQRFNEQLEQKVKERTAALSAEIAERKRAEAELEKHQEQLEEMVEERTQELLDAQEQLVRREKLAVLGQLAGGVAHELRNPLGVISNAAYYLKMVHPDADDTTKEYLDMISSEVHGAEKIISDLLDLARTRLGEREEIAVSVLVDRVLEKHPLPEGVQVTTQIADDLPRVYVDPGKIDQVLLNLVTNACQAMPEGGQLTINAAGRGDPRGRPEVSISITDTGCGISAENMEKVFEPLFTTKARGIGLGLPVAKTLVEGHGGTIGVESQVGQGSTFTVRLPLGVSGAVEGEGA